MKDTQTAISTLFRAIEEKTEQGVKNVCDNGMVETWDRTNILRRMFADEARAQTALTRAMRAVQQYTDQ